MHQDARTVHFYQDARRSLGNYVVDVDGNVLLDVVRPHRVPEPRATTTPTCWPPPARVGSSGRSATARPSGIAPPPEWVELVEGPFADVAPHGLPRMMTVTSGTEAVENALKAAFIWKAAD
jgi:4-aminobutyrate aminotransferase/(S)-3-amino-2-methylpropionate transaminase